MDSQYCQGLSCLIALASSLSAKEAVKKAQEKLNVSMTKLGDTPQTLKIPVFAKYKYDKALIKAKKAMTVHYYLVDKIEGKYFKSSFDIVEKESFEVAYLVLDDDPKQKSILEKYDVEKDVTDWEEAPSTVKLSALIDHYIENVASSKRLPGLAKLRTEMLKDRNTALAKS